MARRTQRDARARAKLLEGGIACFAGCEGAADLVCVASEHLFAIPGCLAAFVPDH